jgi:hypothetical protein
MSPHFGLTETETNGLHLSYVTSRFSITAQGQIEMAFPFQLYGLSQTLREEHKLRVFENRVLRRIFGQKRDKVIGGWRKLHNEELHNLYSFTSIIRMI